MPRVVCEAILARLARIHLTALRFLCAANTKAPSDDPVRRGLFGLSCLTRIIPDIANPSQAKIEPNPRNCGARARTTPVAPAVHERICPPSGGVYRSQRNLGIHGCR